MPFSCFLFRPRKSCEKHRKCSHTNVSNASVIRFSTPPAQTATFAFTSESGYTTRLSEKDRTQGLTRRNRGRFGWGRYFYPRSVLRGSETLRGQGIERQTLPFLCLGRGHSRRMQRAFGTAMRLCASLFRGVAAPSGCVFFGALIAPLLQTLLRYGTLKLISKKLSYRRLWMKHSCCLTARCRNISDKTIKYGQYAGAG